MTENGRLAGKAALVLGAAGAGNMGQMIARTLAGEGARVMVSGRNEASLRCLAEEIGGKWLPCDITSKVDLEALAQGTIAAFGGLDIAVNATGLVTRGAFLDVTEDDLDRVLGVQFKGAFFFLQAVIDAMLDRGGAIIQISSATAHIMAPGVSPYMGTKAGMEHVARAAANDFGAHNIRINSIAPGFTETPMTAPTAASPGIREAFAACYPLGRVGTSQDVAQAVVWLASDECFMTGETLQVNGGLTLRRNPTADDIARAREACAHPQTSN